MNESDFIRNVANYRVYVGLTPSQKYAVLKCLSSSGEKIGFLGSGLNDIALLRQADVGFAQSVTASPKAGGVDVSGRGSGGPDQKNKGSGCESLKFISEVIISEPDRNGNGGFSG